MRKSKDKVLVAMSGGVDSSVAAVLLKEQGFRPIGITLKLFCYAGTTLQKRACCSLEAISDARAVCQKLGYPHYVIDVAKVFANKIIDNFVSEYLAGRTPNPCVRCNQLVKFAGLLKKAHELGAKFVATGHYVKKVKSQKPARFASPGEAGGIRVQTVYHIYKSRDKYKDQSYFLWGLNQKQLEHILFPLGDYTKKEVRSLARKFGLKVAQKPSSQEICFIETDYRDFIQKRLGSTFKAGPIITTEGQRIGEHQGLSSYTIGQRAGLGGRGPYYVVKIDLKNNTLVVTNQRDDPALFSRQLKVRNVHWISAQEPKMPLKVSAQIRYRQKPQAATVSRTPKNAYQVNFKKPQRAITPGQSVVFSQDDEILGGGITE